MSRRVVLTRRADRELEDAADWWAQHRSRHQAARWYQDFSDTLASLAENPERCPRAPENGRFPYEIRELHYGFGSRLTHRAVFTIRPDMVLVLTIRHAAQAELTEVCRTIDTPVAAIYWSRRLVAGCKRGDKSPKEKAMTIHRTPNASRPATGATRTLRRGAPGF